MDDRTLMALLLPVGLGLTLFGIPSASRGFRRLAVWLTLALTAWYAAWRVTDTLPAFAWDVVVLWPWVFFGLEALALAYEAWSLRVMGRVRDRRPEADTYEAMLRPRERLPTVDVFIATYNEKQEILEPSIRAALALDYPKELLEVWVLDDSCRAWLEELCERLGAGYFARPTNEHGKAGNLNYAFPRTSGDCILVLDADFVVSRNLLFRTLGFLTENADVGVVQTPQHFRNPDPIQHNLLGTGAWTEEQHFFMTVTQPCRDAHGNAFCVGTGFVARRAALDKLGGFAQGTLSEDLQLSYALLNHGYRTVFLNEKLAHGLAPESVPEFIKQRVRWCMGTVQQLFIPTGPVRGTGLTLMQRLFYAETVLYWLTFPFLVLLLVAPIVYWLTGVPALHASTEDVLLILVPRALARSVVLYWLSDGKVVPIATAVGKVVPAFHLSAAVIKGLFNPFGAPFRVTTKGQSRDGVIVHWRLFGLFAGLAALLLGAMLSNLLGYADVAGPGGVGPLDVLWGMCSLLVLTLAAMVCIELPPAEEAEETLRGRLGATSRAIVRRLFA